MLAFALGKKHKLFQNSKTYQEIQKRLHVIGVKSVLLKGRYKY